MDKVHARGRKLGGMEGRESGKGRGDEEIIVNPDRGGEMKKWIYGGIAYILFIPPALTIIRYSPTELIKMIAIQCLMLLYFGTLRGINLSLLSRHPSGTEQAID